MVFNAPTSDPAEGSVRHIVPLHSPVFIRIILFFLLRFRAEGLNQMGCAPVRPGKAMNPKLCMNQSLAAVAMIRGRP